MFGIGLLKGLLQLKKFIWTCIYSSVPQQKSWTFGSIKISQKTPTNFIKTQPKDFVKSLAGLHEVPEYPDQATRFRGQDLIGLKTDAQIAQVVPNIVLLE